MWCLFIAMCSLEKIALHNNEHIFLCDILYCALASFISQKHDMRFIFITENERN